MSKAAKPQYHVKVYAKEGNFQDEFAVEKESEILPYLQRSWANWATCTFECIYGVKVRIEVHSKHTLNITKKGTK